jgi:hypothetical protein
MTTLQHSALLGLFTLGFIATPGAPALAQGALKPAEALVVNPPNRPVPTSAGTGISHLGVPLTDHVMLVGVSGIDGGECGGQAKSMALLSSAGTPAATAFVVPAGRSLVVLDVDAVIVTDDLAKFDVGSSVGASLVTPSNVNTGVLMSHLTPGVLITIAGMEAVQVNSTITAGVIFGPGQQVCVRAEVRGFGASFSDNGRVATTMVRGYLR